MPRGDGQHVGAGRRLVEEVDPGSHFRPEAHGFGNDSRAERTSDLSRGNELPGAPQARVQTALQSDCRMARTRRARHLFRLRGVAAERRLAVDRFAGLQCGQDEFAVSRHLDGDGDDIDQVVANHRQRIGEPTLGTKRLQPPPARSARCALPRRRASGRQDL